MDRIKLDEYRLQFRPLRQTDLFLNPEEEWKRKNEILEGILTDTTANFYYRNKLLNHKHTRIKKYMHHFQIANKKIARLEQDFKRAEFDNEPSSNVFILNEKNEQKFFIESDRTSFGDSKILARIIENYINLNLRQNGLAVTINPEIEESEFWNLVEKYDGQIKSIEFHLAYPNLPKAHTTISDELKKVLNSVDAADGKFEIKAEKDKHLNISKSNKEIESLNNASSLQGKPITIKLDRDRKFYKTGKMRKSREIIEISGSDPEELSRIAKELFQK